MMQKIHQLLEMEIKSHPENRVDVLITIKEGYNPESLKMETYKVLMDTIILATLDAKEIVELSKNQNVLSIEKDSEMGIL